MKWTKMYTYGTGVVKELAQIVRPTGAVVYAARQTLSQVRLTTFQDPAYLLRMTARDVVDNALRTALVEDEPLGDVAHYLVSIHRENDTRTQEVTIGAKVHRVFPADGVTPGTDAPIYQPTAYPPPEPPTPFTPNFTRF